MVRVSSFEAIVQALNEARARYLIAGGLAVNAHGYLRMTRDLDLVLDMRRENLERALRALQGLGYQPLLPVVLSDFTDPDQRAEWIRDKGMVVFQLWSREHPEMNIDIFAEAPFDFDTEYERALQGEMAPGLETRFISLSTLIRMKEDADRDRDRDDIHQLRLIREQLDDEQDR